MGINLGSIPHLSNLQTVSEIVQKAKQNRWALFQNLSSILYHHPTKTLEKNSNVNGVLSVFIPALKELTGVNIEYYNTLPISSKNFPNRDKIKHQVNALRLTTSDMMIIEIISDNMEVLLEDGKLMVLAEKYFPFKSLNMNETRYYWMLAVLNDLSLFIECLHLLNYKFRSYNVGTKYPKNNKSYFYMSHKNSTSAYVCEMFAVNHILTSKEMYMHD